MKELNFLPVASTPETFADFSVTLRERGQMVLDQVASLEQLVQTFEQVQVDVAVVAEDLQQGSGLNLVRDLVKRIPLINCALVSHLYPHEFHEATEGLGVLMQLPPNPGPEEADELLTRLAAIYDISIKR